MNVNEALDRLGLFGAETDEDVLTAHANRREHYEARREKAPSEALSARFASAIVLLDEARDTVLAALAEESLAQSDAAEAPEPEEAEISGSDGPAETTIRPTARGGDAASAAPSIGIGPGVLVLERYEIREQLGSGGMGVVFKAWDRVRQELLAIKFMLPQFIDDEEAKARFLQEARASCGLSHPNIINVFDVQAVGNLLFITMELLVGQTLREAMELRKIARTPWSPDEAGEVARQLTSALEYANETTVHRDIKPENVFLCEDGTQKLMDFGIVHLLNASQFTRTSVATGSAYYMAPEQLTGAGNIDPRADQYSVGVVLYELLTGQLPTGATAHVRKLRTDVPKSMAAAIMRAIEPAPDKRFPSITLFFQAFHGKGWQFPWKPLGIAAGVVLGLSVLFLFREPLIELLPNSEERARLQASAIQSQGKLTSLQQRLDKLKEEQSRRLVDVNTRIERLRDQLGVVQDQDERDRMRSDLQAAENELALSSEFASMASAWVYESDELVQAEATAQLANAQLKDEDWKRSAPSFANAVQDYERFLAMLPSIEKALAAKYEYESVMDSWVGVMARLELGTFEASEEQQRLTKSADAYLEAGRFDEAAANWASARDTLATQTEDVRDEAVSSLMAEAADAVSDSRLLSPPDNNAVSRYELILSLDPTHTKARSALESIAKQYLDWADAAMRSEQFDRASSFVGNARIMASRPVSASIEVELLTRADKLDEAIARSRQVVAERKRREEEQRRIAEQQQREEQQLREEAERQRQAQIRAEKDRKNRIAQCESRCRSAQVSCEDRISDCSSPNYARCLAIQARGFACPGGDFSCLNGVNAEANQCQEDEQYEAQQCYDRKDNQEFQCESQAQNCYARCG